ncbi:MAG: signal peptide peptidase SppA [Halobacteriaceae archaeon]
MSDGADSVPKQLGRVIIIVVAAAVTAVASWVLFYRIPGENLARLFGVVLVVVLTGAGLRLGTSIASSALAPYNVAEVSVEGPITRGGGGLLPATPGGATADEIVDQLDRADADDNVDALIVHLNTPGGEVVPSDDIRDAAQDFDGPTVAYATDTCASGGYWIASGCDRIFAREGSIVGSIGVLGSRPNLKGLADRLGVEYEQLTAGEYKDAGSPLKEFTEQDREYLQSIVDDYYETFIDRVTAGRDIDAETVRDTEARVYLGPEAEDIGLVDALADHAGVEDYLADQLGTGVTVREFEPQRRLTTRIGLGARHLAHAVGAGVGSALTEDDLGFRFR